MIAPRGVSRPLVGVARVSSYGLLLAATIGLSCLDLLVTLDRRWFPWDEGTLGQMAERVLRASCHTGTSSTRIRAV